MKKTTYLVFSLFLCLNLFGQSIQLEKFNKAFFTEDFNSENTHFNFEINRENYIAVDDGDLFLNRTNPTSHHIVFSKAAIELNTYRINTALKLGPSSKRYNYAGIVINSTKDSKETVAVEINGKQEYRIRKITTSSKFLSGSETNDGWVHNEHIRKNEVFDYLDIISNNGKYDLFINYQHISTFKVPERKNGGFGFIIGPNSQARIDFINAYEEKDKIIDKDLKKIESKLDQITTNNYTIKKLEKEKEVLIKKLNNCSVLKKENIKTVITSKNEIIEATKSIALIKSQLNDIKKEKNNLKNQLEKANNKLKSANKIIVQHETEKKSFNTKMLEFKEAKAKLNKFKLENQDLKKRLSQTKETNSKFNEEINVLKEKNKDYQQFKKEHENTKLILVKTNTQLEKKNNDLEKMKKKTSSLNELQVELSELKQQNLKLTSQLNILNTKYKRLKKNEENIQNSLANYSKNLTLKKSENTAEMTNEYLKSKHNEIQQLNLKYYNLEKRNKLLENQNDIIVAQNNEQKRIAFQFAEAFQLEKEKNRQLHNEIYSLYSVDQSSENSKDVVYRIQLGIFDKLIDVEGIEDLTTIHTQAQQVIYIAGKFDNFNSARNYLLEMSKKGFEDAFIVKF